MEFSGKHLFPVPDDISDSYVDAVYCKCSHVHKRAVDVVTFYKLDMEEFGIDEIDSVKVSFEIKNADNWETLDATDMISVELAAKETQAPTEAKTKTESK